MESNIISALTTLIGIIIGVVGGYLVNRRQQGANVAKTNTDARIADDVAKADTAKKEVETRLLDIEAKQADVTYYQKLVDDMQARMKDRDEARAIEQRELIAQVAEIKSAQTATQNLHDDLIKELLAKIDGLVVSLGDADIKIAALQDQISELQLRVEDSNKIITSLQEQVVGLQNEVREGNETITLLRSEIQTLLVQQVQTEKEGLAETNAALTKALK